MLKMLLVSGIFGADTTGGSLLWLLQLGEGPPGLACPALQHHHVLVGVVEILKFWSNSHVFLNTCFEIQGKQWSGVCVWVVFSHLIVLQKENLSYVGFPRSKALQSPSAGYPSPGHCVDCLFLLLRFPPQSLFLPVKTHSNLWGWQSAKLCLLEEKFWRLHSAVRIEDISKTFKASQLRGQEYEGTQRNASR